MKTIYLDNSATTKVRKEVVETMMPYFNEIYGNPGSMHSEGLGGQEALDNAREKVAEQLHCKPEEIIFTGSGTESINTAIKGIAHHYNKKMNKGKHIITQKTEHHAVLDSCEFLEKEGYEVTYLDVDRYGMVNPEDIKNAIKEDTILVSIMYANNEIGTIQPIKKISKICNDAKVLFHTDACQAAGYLNMNIEELGVDLLSLNGSKMYGPKGVGILYKKRGVMFTPLIHGGGQENRLRSGTENIPAIVGFAKALELAEQEKKQETKRITTLAHKLRDGILKTIPKAFLNGHPTERLPNNVNITILDIEGEAALLYMDKEGICASTGSACTSKTLDPSHVILALGMPYEAAHGSIRFSLGKNTTEKGITHLLKILPEIIKNLRGLSPVKLDAKDFEKYMTEENKKISIPEYKKQNKKIEDAAQRTPEILNQGATA